MAQLNTMTNGQAPIVSHETNAPISVNKKKAKRRAKAAAKQEAEGPTSGKVREDVTAYQHEDEYEPFDEADADKPYFSDEDGDRYSGSYGRTHSANGFMDSMPNSRTSRKKGRKSRQHDPLGGLAPTQPGSSSIMSKEKIWNTSSQEERERIKAFWLSLGEEDRRSLVKVEKDAVLKKMKEQQKHSCSCTVCGRKRIAIEEELEVLYDAYYKELEQYANRQGSGPPPMLSGPQRFGQISGLQPPNRLPSAFNGTRPIRGRIREHFDNEDDEGGDEYDSELELEEDEYSDEEVVSQFSPDHATDFFNFGQSLTVKGGILTVADDLLKNDGKKFIEMMEQLAERRMAREEDAKEQFVNGYGHPQSGMPLHNHSHGHNHPPVPEDEEEYDSQEDDEEYDDEDEDYEEEDMGMTEAQRMEEGRRMFQIFAARMFEQRVLSAYKEKVAAERQFKLIQEEDEEANAAEARKAKKARDAAKKKEKAQAKKLALAEEKAKREAEKAAQEAALREAEAKKLEEQRQKAEEKRRKREAQKKAEEEERLRKEVEKQKRLQDQREREAESIRKAKEAKERERKEKEEARLKEKELKEAKEAEARLRKEKLEKEKREAQTKAKVDKPSTERSKSHEQPPPAVPTQIAKRPNPQAPVPLPPGLAGSASNASPHLAVATPVMPKAPTPKRQPSQSQKDVAPIPHTPQAVSNASSNSSPHPSTPLQSSPGAAPPGKALPHLYQPQAVSPLHPSLKGTPSPFAGMPPMSMNGFPPGGHLGLNTGPGGRMPHDPSMNVQQGFGHFRPVPSAMGFPAMNGFPPQSGRGFPMAHAPPGFHNQFPVPQMSQFSGQNEHPPMPSHSRQHSASFDKHAENTSPASAQPIARPAPIGRPPSTQGHRSRDGRRIDVEELSNHLGSSALLDDADEPLSTPSTRRASAAPGPASLNRHGFPPPIHFGLDAPNYGGSIGFGSGWGSHNSSGNPFGTSSLPGQGHVGSWTNPTQFSSMNAPTNMRPSQPRSVAVRIMLCNACKNLEGLTPDGFHSIAAIQDQLDVINPYGEQAITTKEILDLCETEGSAHNGGGFFDIRSSPDGFSIRYEADAHTYGRSGGAVGAPGDIGSPVVGAGQLHRGFHGPPGISAPDGF